MMRLTAFFAVIVLANASGLYSLGDLASYGLGDGSLSRQEIRSPDGIVRGTLTYIDGDGKIKSISYGGDNDVEIQKSSSSTETPMRAEEDSDEGQQSDESQNKSEEMKEETVDESSGNNQNQTASTEENDNAKVSALPQPVAYTPEVAAARAAHFAARDRAILLQQLAANQEQLEANQQQLLNQQQIVEYPPIYREYYGAAKPLRTGLNPYYYL